VLGTAVGHRRTQHSGGGVMATLSVAAPAVLSTSESGFAFSNRDSSISLPAFIATLGAPRQKPAAVLAHYAGIGARAAELALQRGGGLSAPALTNALRSRVGDRVLDFLLGDPAPLWRAAERRLMGVAELERELESLEQKRRHLLAELAAREQGRR
jgi:hypothetical protein